MNTYRDQVEYGEWYPVSDKKLIISIMVKEKDQDSRICFAHYSVAPRFIRNIDLNIFHKLFRISKVDLFNKRWKKAIKFCIKNNSKVKEINEEIEQMMANRNIIADENNKVVKEIVMHS